VSPRVYRVVALPAPTEREKSQLYLQRYVPHMPSAGEIVIWDRSWYNRAGVERVMGFCTEKEVQRFLDLVPAFERIMIDEGIILIKYWLEVSMARLHRPQRPFPSVNARQLSREYHACQSRGDLIVSPPDTDDFQLAICWPRG
jgi:polyphosphate kinase 2 (PPK2 family)